MNLLRSMGIFSVMALIGPLIWIIYIPSGMPLWLVSYHQDMRLMLYPTWILGLSIAGYESTSRVFEASVVSTAANVILFAAVGALLYYLRKTNWFWVVVAIFVLLLATPLYFAEGLSNLSVTIPAVLTGLCIIAGGAALVRKLP